MDCNQFGYKTIGVTIRRLKTTKSERQINFFVNLPKTFLNPFLLKERGSPLTLCHQVTFYE